LIKQYLYGIVRGMKLKAYWKQLNRKERQLYVDAVGVSLGYMTVHLMPARKTPRNKVMYALSDESQGLVTHSEVLDHFYPNKNT